MSGLFVDQFHAVAKRVRNMTTANSRNALIVADRDTRGVQSIDQFVVIHTSQGRMGFSRWPEIGFDAKMDLNRSALKPASTPFR